MILPKASIPIVTNLCSSGCSSITVIAKSSVNINPLPADYKELTGYPGYYRVDSGEYPIVYRFDPDADLVEVILAGKRNDDEVYKQLKRLLG
jgi:mRNA-degrading endonuclease RelE of RelBE toxin-antitoxin system